MKLEDASSPNLLIGNWGFGAGGYGGELWMTASKIQAGIKLCLMIIAGNRQLFISLISRPSAQMVETNILKRWNSSKKIEKNRKTDHIELTWV